MRRVMGAVGTVILEILKWILRIILGALKLVLGLARFPSSFSPFIFRSIRLLI
jgi:hypothetical protein